MLKEFLKIFRKPSDDKGEDLPVLTLTEMTEIAQHGDAEKRAQVPRAKTPSRSFYTSLPTITKRQFGARLLRIRTHRARLIGFSPKTMTTMCAAS